MATLAQIAANRINALKSTGPKTEEGKATSRRNALTHGLTASVLLTDAEEAALPVRIEAFSAAYAPRDDEGRWLVEEAARASLRSERAFAEEEAQIALDAARAETSWDEDQYWSADFLGAGISRDPRRVRARLERSRAGCLWLAARWAELVPDADLAEEPIIAAWALDLLGVPRPERPRCRLLMPEPGQSAADRLRAVAESEVGRLRRRAQALRDIDALEQAHAAAGVGEPSPALRRIRRYATEVARALRWAFTRLDRLGRTPAAPPAREPAPPAPPPPPQDPVPPAPARSSLATLSARAVASLASFLDAPPVPGADVPLPIAAGRSPAKRPPSPLDRRKRR